MRLPTTWWMSFRACDSNITCQRMLCSSPSPVHLFPDVFNLLPEACVASLGNMRPRPNDKPAPRAQAHAAQRDFLLQECGNWARNATGRGCLRHPDSACPVMWSAPPGAEAPAPLKVNFSGPMCLPWARMGTREDMAHASMQSFHAWLAHVAAGHYDIVFLENAPGFKFHHFLRPMSKHYSVFKAVFGPEDSQLRFPV